MFSCCYIVLYFKVGDSASLRIFSSPLSEIVLWSLFAKIPEFHRPRSATSCSTLRERDARSSPNASQVSWKKLKKDKKGPFERGKFWLFSIRKYLTDIFQRGSPKDLQLAKAYQQAIDPRGGQITAVTAKDRIYKLELTKIDEQLHKNGPRVTTSVRA